MADSKTITILGSSGSIGTQSLDVIRSLNGEFRIAYLTVNSRTDILTKQIEQFAPLGVVIGDEKKYKEFKVNSGYKGKILYGDDGLLEASSYSGNDLVLSSLVGFAGVAPTLEAISSGTDIALANKEVLVSAGRIVTKAAKDKGVNLIAVDSEHNALLQCLAGEDFESVRKLILTASGGPFWNLDIDKFKNITKVDALNHPNWDMGAKITIDSATMMNKGFEIIEAYWLFGLDIKFIDVLVHPQSIVHSLVEFKDGSFKAQLGMPDMRIPISYALTYPERRDYDFPSLNLSEISKLEFYEPDLVKFKCLRLAYDAIQLGGMAPAVLNAANEVAVAEFLDENIRFVDIPEILDHAIHSFDNKIDYTLKDIYDIDRQTRLTAEHFIKENC